MGYRILCGYDQSHGSEKAYEYAVQLAKRFEGELFVVAVFQPSDAARGVKSDALLESARERFGAGFAQLQAKAADAGVAVTLEVSVGYPAQQVLKKAEQLRADHIVVGQRGTNAFQRQTTGSVSLRIVSHGGASVTVVR